MKVFVADHAFHACKVGIGGGGGLGEHEPGVEDVQALVFHGAHVEVAGGHHHEALQIQRQAKARFVPGHGGHERAHGVAGLVQIARAHKDLQQVLLARAGGDALLARHQAAGHHGEQVAGLFVRVVPDGEMAPIVQIAAFNQVAVGQQHGPARLVGAQGDGVGGHHVGPVQKVGDAAKALGLALREKVAAAHVQAHEARVFFRAAGGEDFQLERLRPFGQVFQHQRLAVHAKRAALPAQQHAREAEFIAIQPQRLRGHIGIAAQRHAVEHAGLGRVQVKSEVHAVDPERGRGVVGAADGGGLRMVHGGVVQEKECGKGRAVFRPAAHEKEFKKRSRSGWVKNGFREVSTRTSRYGYKSKISLSFQVTNGVKKATAPRPCGFSARGGCCC